jgi:hypothetical protein
MREMNFLHVALVTALVVCSAATAMAQTDFSGEWTVVRSQDNTENPWVGDWFGLPLNAAGLARAESWDASIQEYLAVTMIVDDPRYLQQPYIKTYEYKKQNDATDWNPTPCSAK